MKLSHCIALAVTFMSSSAISAPLATVERDGSYVAVEPFAPNVVHVTIALEPDLIGKTPNYGVVAKSDSAGWSRISGADGDRFSSGAMTLTVDPQPWPKAPDLSARYFASSLPPVSLSIADSTGKPLLKMAGWDMTPQTVNGERTFRVGANFSVTPNEHFYGLGQNQEGFLDLRGHTIDCRHSYEAPAG